MTAFELHDKKAKRVYAELVFLLELCEYQRKHYPDALDYLEVFRRVKSIIK